MPLKVATGNMYSWVTHTHTHLGGECPHKCVYCYVQSMAERFPAMKKRYSGPLRLLADEFKVKYDEKTCRKNGGKYPATIFMEHCNDLLSFTEQDSVKDDDIRAIIGHCLTFPDNTYVFQSKNPLRFKDFVWPKNSIFGTTIETNRTFSGKIISFAPTPLSRFVGLLELDQPRKFVTIEPVLDFDVDILAGWIAEINPEFLNLGADSKNHHLPEPTVEKIHQLVAKLKEYGIELREKHNLQRLMAK